MVWSGFQGLGLMDMYYKSFPFFLSPVCLDAFSFVLCWGVCHCLVFMSCLFLYPYIPLASVLAGVLEKKREMVILNIYESVFYEVSGNSDTTGWKRQHWRVATNTSGNACCCIMYLWSDHAGCPG